MPNPKTIRFTLISFIALAAGLGLAVWIEHSLAKPFFESVFNGTSFSEYLNETIRLHREQNPEIRTLDFYLDRRISAAFRLIYLAGVLGWMGILAFILRDRTLPALKRFWVDPEPPVNLDIFRIALFSTLFFVDSKEFLFFSSLPDELIFTPSGLGWLVAAMPRNESLAGILSFIWKVCCVTGILGLFTRTSAAIMAVMGLYLLGVPQLFGKVNHYHHFIWFLTIIALGPASVMLSIDAIVAAWKRADRGSTRPPNPSPVYAVPLRLSLILIGLLYFFPGFWKWILGGPDWIFSNNLRFHLYSKWSEFASWTPILPFDQYTLPLIAGALGTIIFELSVIFAVLFPVTRPCIGIAGLMFHNMTALTMRISFWSLQPLYVIFFNWHNIFAAIGKQVFRTPLYILYDGNCKMCRRTAATLAVFDLFQRIVYVNALDTQEHQRLGLPHIETSVLLKDMYAVDEHQQWAGYEAYRAIAIRMPVLWPILPFLYLWPITRIGPILYRRIADSRLCSIRYATTQPSPIPKPRKTGLPLVLFAATAIVFMGWYGIKRQMAAWPFACYPTFDHVIRTPVRRTIVVEATDANGQIIPWDQARITNSFKTERYHGLLNSILAKKDTDTRNLCLQSFWSILLAIDPRLAKASSVRFYQANISTLPSDRDNRLIDRVFLLEIQP